MTQQQTICINLLIALSIKCLDNNNDNNIYKWNLHMTTDTLTSESESEKASRINL